MVKLEEISSTATFAWSHDNIPLLVTGTIAGAVDIDFNSTSTCQIWDVFSKTKGDEPRVSCSVENKFYKLAWSKPFEGRKRGVIAGAFENGSIEFWDADILINTKDLEKASIHKSSKHTGPVRALQFNPNQSHILVSGGSRGELYIWDTKSLDEPIAPGHAMTPMDDISSVAWNNSVGHIFASTSNGYTSIWDLKSKREVLHLSYSGNGAKSNFSCVAWHPTQSTKLVTASDSDNSPLILTWDLRNANAPEKILEGHSKGILSLDWCKQDPELLISCGKDNSTILWNPMTGIKLGEYPTTANWAFHTRFAPAVPDVFATSSFDGKIIVQSLQDTAEAAVPIAPSNDEEFWSEISTKETQKPKFYVHQAPKWLKNTSSVSFAFGSKLVVVRSDNPGKSVVVVNKTKIGSNIASKDNLTKALALKDFKPLLDSKMNEQFTNDSDKADWELLKKLSDLGRENILGERQEQAPEENKEEESKANPLKESENSGDVQNGDSFFDELSAGMKNGPKESTATETYIPKGNFSLFNALTPESEKKIIKLILKNKIDEAVTACLGQGKLHEALILALNGSQVSKEKVRNAYFKLNSESELSRVLYSSSTGDITDLVVNADVSNWRDIALSIFAFCKDENEINSKIIELGDRILNSSEKWALQKNDALSCYFAGSGIEKIAVMWLNEMPSMEKDLQLSESSNIKSPSDARYEVLSDFIEKIVSYKLIAKISKPFEGPLVSNIGAVILEFATLNANYGDFELAERCLDLLPEDFEGLRTEKERILNASGKKSANQKHKVGSSYKGATQGPYGGYTSDRPVGGISASYAPSTVPGVPAIGQKPAPSSYRPAAAVLGSSVNDPPAASAPYVPKQTYAKPPAPVAGYNPYKPAMPSTPSTSDIISPPPSGPPKASTRLDTEGWNDIPDAFKVQAAPRRVTAAPVSQPSTPGVTTPNGNSKRPSVGPPVAPPPPKGISRTSSKASIPQTNISLPSSPKVPHPNTVSRYAPPPGTTSAPPLQGTTTSHAASNAPPIATHGIPPPPKNPYAPSERSSSPSVKTPFAAPVAPPLKSPSFSSASIVPPAVGRPPTAPPKNPYAPPSNLGSPSIQPAGIPTPKMGGVMPPPPTTAFNKPPSVTTPPPRPDHSASTSTVSVAPPTTEVKHTYPSGDRSHIPESSLPIYNSLGGLLEELKPKIPEKYARHCAAMEKRLNILFDHLNNDDLLSKETVESLKEVCSALEAKDFQKANALNIQIATNHSEETANWHTGVKYLIQMAEVL